MLFIHLVMAVFATHRLTEMFIGDRIFESLRKKYPSYLWLCQRCLSVWMGVVTMLAFIYLPWFNWPFAMSWLYFVHNDIILARKQMAGRKFIAVIDAMGNGSVQTAEFNQQEVVNMCAKLVNPEVPKVEDVKA